MLMEWEGERRVESQTQTFILSNWIAVMQTMEQNMTHFYHERKAVWNTGRSDGVCTSLLCCSIDLLMINVSSI